MRAARRCADCFTMKKTLFALLAGILMGAGGVFLWAHARDVRADADAAAAAALQEREMEKLRRQLAGERDAAAGLRRQLADSSRDQKPLELNQIDIQRLLNDARPLMKSLAIMFDGERKKMTERMIRGMAEKLAEQMGLTEEQTADLIAHFMKLDEQNFAKILAMLDKPMTLIDVFSAMNEMNPAKNMDAYVAAKLTPEQKLAWENRKLETKAQQIERTANWQLRRMDRLNLDETQKDQVFDILVKTNPQYDTTLAVEGLSEEAGSFEAGKSQEDAIAAVLREDQLAQYKEIQERQQSERQRWSNALGGFDPMQFFQGMSGMEALGGGFGGRGRRGER
jgi:hypothetical protein